MLEPSPDDTSRSKRERWAYLESLPTIAEEGAYQFVHGSLREPLIEYVFGDKYALWDPAQLEALFPLVKQICFSGHTHIPAIIRDDRTCWYPKGTVAISELQRDRKYIVNVGAVGQPRDGDPHACYAIFDGDAVQYVRVEYDIERTRRKILALPALANRLGERLRVER